jgi:uncharacterized protein (TIGR03067 family)
MAKTLPARPNLDHLRAQAKRLLADLRDGKTSAAQTFIAHLPAAQRMTAEGVRRAGLRLADAQSAIARQSGFDNWPSLARHVEHLRSLEGEWAFRSLEVDGRKIAAAMLGSSKLQIDGDRFRMESSEATYEGVFNIDVEADPPFIDIEFVEGPEAGNWSYGIYRLNGDDLTFCLGLAGASRPTRFATAPHTGHALERLRRVSAARPDDVQGGKRAAGKTASARAAAAPAPAIDESAFTFRMTPLLERLQGEWLPVALVSSGKPLEDALLTYGVRTTIGNEAKVVFGGQTMLHAKMRFDDSAKPTAVDYLNIGRGAKSLSLGVFEWVGDQARFCMAPAGAPRPTDFSCDAGSGRTLSQWKKKTPPR